MSKMNSALIESVQNLEKANNVVLLDGRPIDSPCPGCRGAGYTVQGLLAVICDICRGQRSEA